MKKLLFLFLLTVPSLSFGISTKILFSSTTQTLDYYDSQGTIVLSIPTNMPTTMLTPGGTQGLPGTDGHSPAVSMNGDQITVDGLIVGPHLTGTNGERGLTGNTGPMPTVTGTGWAHATGGSWDAAASTPTPAQVGAAAAVHTHAPSEITGTAVTTNDSRLSDARTPTTHSHAPGDITGTAVVTSDSRLSDARTPVAHNQADTTITFTNNTTGNVSTSAHGYAPMGTAGTTQFWRQDWTLATPTVSVVWGGITGTLSNQTDLNTALSGKQATLTRATGAMVYAALSNGTLALDFGTNSAVKVTPTATGSFTTTVPAAGNVGHLIVLTSGASSYTMTFGTGFKSTGTLATGTTSGKYFVIHFVSDGTYMIEAGRTVAQ